MLGIIIIEYNLIYYLVYIYVNFMQIRRRFLDTRRRLFQKFQIRENSVRLLN